MPWNEVTTVKLRTEFVRLAQAKCANLSQLCEQLSDQSQDWLQVAGSLPLPRRFRSRRPKPTTCRSLPAEHPRTSRPKCCDCVSSIRPGEAERFIAAWSCSGERTCRPRAPSRQSSAVTATSRRTRPPHGPLSASSASGPTSCGRWISKGTSLLPPVVVIPDRARRPFPLLCRAASLCRRAE